MTYTAANIEAAKRNVAKLVSEGMKKAREMGLITNDESYNTALKICIDEAYAFLAAKGYIEQEA